MNDELSSLKSAMLGHAVADAMGVPVEFESRETLKKDPVTGYRGYGSHSVPAGTWSDDTSMNLASLDSLSRGLDYGDMLERFCRWKNQAAYTATDEVFDMGISTVERRLRSDLSLCTYSLNEVRAAELLWQLPVHRQSSDRTEGSRRRGSQVWCALCRAAYSGLRPRQRRFPL